MLCFSKPQNMPILVDLGERGGVGFGPKWGKPPKKLYYYQSHISFLFHFGDELNDASLTIDY
jgi:hypothetical protein